MPPPVFIYVGGVVIALGAAYALKQFVYEPYVAPQLERWAQAFVDSRHRAREERRERRMHAPMQMRSSSSHVPSSAGAGGGAYVPLKGGEENDYRRGHSKPPSPSPAIHTQEQQNEWDDPLSPVPVELEKLMSEKDRLSWSERELPAHMPLPAASAPGLRKRTGSRPASRPQSFVEIVEVPGIPVSAYVPLTPQTTHTGSPRPGEGRLQHPLSPVPAVPSQQQQQPLNQAVPLLSPPMSATSPPAPVVRALSPRTSPASAAQYPPLLSIIDDPTTTATTLDPFNPTPSPSLHSLAPISSENNTPYPSRPPSSLSSVLSPPHTTLSLPSRPASRAQSWTALSRAGSSAGFGGSDADVLSRSSASAMGSDDEDLEMEGSEWGSVGWDTVSRQSGVSGDYVRM